MKKEIWMNYNGELVEVWFNPCGCHPGDFILTWGKRYNQSLSYSLESQEKAIQWLTWRKYISLE